jgi:hypothetical protein
MPVGLNEIPSFIIKGRFKTAAPVLTQAFDLGLLKGAFLSIWQVSPYSKWATAHL